MHDGAQLDMFGSSTVEPARVDYVPPPFAPFPDALLRRLNATLRMLQSAEVMPWPAAEAKGRATLFLGAVERLPPDRRGNLAALFRSEWVRLNGQR
jgi:hypothetical protein